MKKDPSSRCRSFKFDTITVILRNSNNINIVAALMIGGGAGGWNWERMAGLDSENVVELRETYSKLERAQAQGGDESEVSS